MPIDETPPVVENARRRRADAVYAVVEEAARQCYVRALKLLPPDLKAALRRARDDETDETGRGLLDIMLENVDGGRARHQPRLPGHRHGRLLARGRRGTAP